VGAVTSAVGAAASKTAGAAQVRHMGARNFAAHELHVDRLKINSNLMQPIKDDHVMLHRNATPFLRRQT